MKYRILIYFAFFSLVLVIISGCGDSEDDTIIFLEITNIDVSPSTIEVGEIAILEASVSYAWDDSWMGYFWKASGGTIGIGVDSDPKSGRALGTGDSGKRAKYIAPDQPGIYTIELVVEVSYFSDKETVEITVTPGQALPTTAITLDINTHWPAEARNDKLAYNMNVKSITTGKVILHYDITQDQDKFDVFLSIEINGVVVLRETAIGAEQPSTAKRTVGEIDVSNAITVPGRYVVTFYVSPGDRVKNGWLLNEAKLIGVEGTSDPQQ